MIPCMISRLFTNGGVWNGMAILIGVYDSLSILAGMIGFTMPQTLIAAYGSIPPA